MYSASPRGVLFFNSYDPTHRAHLPAETITATQLQCFSTSVVTGITAQDTSQLEAVMPIHAEMLDMQARCLLEDINIHAFKINHLLSIDAIDTVSKIVADYNHIPLVLTVGPHLYNQVAESHSVIVSDLADAYIDYLAPYAHTVVLDANYLNYWIDEEDENGEALQIEDLAEHIMHLGATHCFVINYQTKDGVMYDLLYHRDGDVQKYTYDIKKPRPAEYADVLSTALSCFLAHEISLHKALEMALRFSLKQVDYQIQLGMGKALLNRLVFYEAN